MGVIAVHLLQESAADKNSQQFCSESQEGLSVKDQATIPEQFSTIRFRTNESRSSRSIPVLIYKRSPYSRRTPKASARLLQTWSHLQSDRELLSAILSFLSREELVRLKGCSRGLKRMCTIRILKNDNNWDLTMGILGPFLGRETQLRQSVMGAGMEEEYEHSEDLDRTSGYFQSEDESGLTEQRLRLDRVITAISFQVRYFQGIMPICAFLLQCFNEKTCYWLLKFMLSRCQHIQNDLPLYGHYLLDLDHEFEQLLPEVHRHLEAMGFELNYFVMKWIMGLFAQDMDKAMLLAFWDLLCQTDVNLISYVIIQIFKLLEPQILASDADGINELLKVRLRQQLSETNAELLMAGSKQLYILRRLAPN